ncbi:multidrug efflux RND transporter permease subunit [Lentisphaerota bacterium ZTH]|nr:multidrug efflux RND transporter permease subunit [Lentisphaerota bacterium]WET05194.1 multidrug efflux RND transporter permease subunit [Lentisphaerota bacterium ZTH]
MISKFFIERPRFALVISIVIVIAGLISIRVLPIAQYPNITPSQVKITANYPGADAETVQKTVVEPIETQVNGVKRMLYMSSTSSDTGDATITVTFGIGTDGDLNTVNVQNRVKWAEAQMPEAVKKRGIIVKEQSSNMLLVAAVYSPDGKYSPLELSNYAAINLKDELARIPGVGDVSILGELKYSLRVWLNPARMASLGLTVDDVSNAIKEQNVQVSAGSLGDAPSSDSQIFRYTVQTRGRLKDVTAFKNIVIKTLPDGASVKIKDIAKVELGSETYSSQGQLNGSPAALLAVYQLPDANGLNIAKQVKEKIAEHRFPEGMKCGVKYDTTKFINASIQEVVKTLAEAVILVILITYLFLGDLRSTLVPSVAIPVSLIGTFGVLYAIGYSINLITLFGLILAIGIVVDDAIVVIENVNRLMHEEGLPPKEAAKKSMDQVTGPVIATTLVLLAMFVPVCFLPGITGELYRQFGITIVVAVLISTLNALTLSPALSGLLLKPMGKGYKKLFIFRKFDELFEKVTSKYIWLVKHLVRKAIFVFAVFLLILFVGFKVYESLPTGFIPDEDQGVFFVNVQLPDGAALARTEKVVKRVEKIMRGISGVEDVISVSGFSILNGTSSPSNAMLIAMLKPWNERPTLKQSQFGIMFQVYKQVVNIPDAMIVPFGVPAIPGIGSTAGFSFMLEDTTGTNPQRLGQYANSLIMAANKEPDLNRVFTTFSANVPQVYLNIDREKALKMGVSIESINNALQGFTGVTYINDINKFGKVYKVQMQAQKNYRSQVNDINDIYVRNSDGDMVPMSTLVQVETKFGPQYLNRYNLYSAVKINGSAASGYSSGQAMATMEKLARELLPRTTRFDWTDMSYQEKEASGKIGVIFSFALLFIYLFLVAQYESWMIPISVMLSVPIAFLGAIGSLWAFGMTNNIYCQVGFVLLFGLAAKTAILIVEFAKVQHEQGMPIVEAAVFAAKLRFRAVLMTAFSFVLGTFPLVIAFGAGAASRRSLGMTVFGGMTVSAIFGTILVPSFYVLVQKLIDWQKKRKERKAA